MEAAVLLQRISERLGIEKLTPMQEDLSKSALPLRIAIISPTGSGKTLAYALPIVRAMGRSEHSAIKAVILVPTRELALQVYEVIHTLARPEYKAAVLYGGHRMETEVNVLAASPDIVVATPGRILDHIHRGNIDLHAVSALVLDEYDKSLELGFLADMRAVVGRMKRAETLILTSATRLNAIPDFLGKAPIDVRDYTLANTTITPDVEFLQVSSPTPDKLETLDRLLRDILNERVIVFLNHREAAERVCKHLLRQGYPAGLYHGGLEQEQRERALIMFANGTTPVLVSTDLASRGLDIDGVGVVVHYHLPGTMEVLTHRNGRTARMGASGRAFAIISNNDKIADFFPTLGEYFPQGDATPKPSTWSTIYFNAGKKEKISRGDIAGFLIQKGGLTKDEVGRIDVKDHCAYVAVLSKKAKAVVAAVTPHKIKNMRVRVSLIEPC